MVIDSATPLIESILAFGIPLERGKQRVQALRLYLGGERDV